MDETKKTPKAPGPTIQGRLAPGKKVGKPHIVLATPSYGNMFCGDYVNSVMRLAYWAGKQDIRLRMAQFNYADIAATRNILLSKFLYEHKEATHLLFVDDDMGFPTQLVADCLALGVDLVGAFYPKRRIDLKKLHASGGQPYASALARATDFVGKPARVQARRGRFVTADYIGTGFMLLSRAGLERFLAKCPELHSDERYRSVLGDWPHPGFVTAFDRLSLKGREFSEDYAFCHRWRKAGFQIWAATDGGITHVGQQTFDAGFGDL